MDCGGTVLKAKFIHALRNRHCEFTIEDARTVLTVEVDVVFAEAGVVAVDYVLEVFVDEHNASAEDDEVEIERGDGVVEVAL